MSQTLDHKIKKHFESFSKGSRKVAEYILDNRERIPFLSASNLGKEVGVSESTVLRLVRFIGFRGYPDLQRNLEEWIKEEIKPAQKLRQISKKYGKKDYYFKILDNDIQNLLSLRKALQQNQLEQITKTIIQSRRKYIIGNRTSYSAAFLCSFFLGRILDDVILLELADPDFYNILAEANERDIVLGFSFPRYSKYTLKTIQFLKKKKCRVIGITDRIVSPLGYISDYVIEVDSSSPTYFNSFTAVVSLINCIAEGISLKNYQHSMNSLRNVDKVIDDFDILIL